jgi:RNA polymerase sigma-70 factor (ECF subfamily)
VIQCGFSNVFPSMLGAAQILPAWPSTGGATLEIIRRVWPHPVKGEGWMTDGKQQEPGRADWASLIEAIARGQDRKAFATLYEYFAPRIKGFMCRSGLSSENAEDLAQEAMLMVWRKAALYNASAGGASTWIFTIARNLRIDALRRQNRRGEINTVDIDDEFIVDAAPLPDAHVVEKQDEQRIRSAMAQLTGEQLRVVELSFFGDLSHSEIAEVLGLPLGTVKSRLRLAMGKLRTRLDELP